MELRTVFEIEPSPLKIKYSDPVMFTGSCFASGIGRKFEAGRFPVLINPAGTVFNPVSVINTLESITESREYSHGDLYFHDGLWLSFDHYTDFLSTRKDHVLEKINRTIKEAGEFMSKVGFRSLHLERQGFTDLRNQEDRSQIAIRSLLGYVHKGTTDS